jgi:hypothetical protein
MRPTPAAETFLSHHFAREYMLSINSHRSMRREVDGDAEDLRELIDADIKQSDKLRRALTVALSGSNVDLPQIAGAWTGLIKTRAEVLDYWAHVYGASAAFGTLVLALAAFFSQPLGSLSYVLSAASLMFALYFGVRKFEIDRRKLWYKFVLCHLEQIKSLALQ